MTSFLKLSHLHEGSGFLLEQAGGEEVGDAPLRREKREKKIRKKENDSLKDAVTAD